MDLKNKDPKNKLNFANNSLNCLVLSFELLIHTEENMGNFIRASQ